MHAVWSVVEIAAFALFAVPTSCIGWKRSMRSSAWPVPEPVNGAFVMSNVAASISVPWT